MSKLIRTVVIGATLAAMNLVAVTALAQAQANGQPAGEQAARPPTERQVGESWRHRQATSQEQTTADATLRRGQARERFSVPSPTPAQVSAPVPAGPGRLPGWLIASLGVLAAKRTRRRARLGHAA